MAADSKSSQTQIAQSTLDELNQAVKVNIVAAGGAGGIATEATSLDILTAVESIDAKTPASPATAGNQTSTNTKLDTLITQTDGVEASLSSIDSKTTADPATATNQASSNTKLDTLITQTDGLEASLSSIDTKTPALVSNSVPVITGLGVPAHDAILPTFAATTDTYVYKTGGVSGTTVSTVVLTYTDATKAVLQSVVRS